MAPFVASTPAGRFKDARLPRGEKRVGFIASFIARKTQANQRNLHRSDTRPTRRRMERRQGE